jgi:hypothetical protein
MQGTVPNPAVGLGAMGWHPMYQKREIAIRRMASPEAPI